MILLPPGKLLSVNPRFAGQLPGIFTLNERVSYLGQWRHGFMSLTAVGAAGVGSVAVPHLDPTLSTNQKRSTAAASATEDGPGLSSTSLTLSNKNTTGEPFGYFRLGSTIVLVFEVPHGSSASWTVVPGDKVKVGQALMR